LAVSIWTDYEQRKAGSNMDLNLAGVFLIVAGALLIVLQIASPARFNDLFLSRSIFGMVMQTKVVGLAVVLFGVLLILVANGLNFILK
jgi:hypothetical protein